MKDYGMLWTITEEYVIRTMESSRRTAYSTLRLILASSILFFRFLFRLEYSLIQDRRLQFIPSKPLTYIFDFFYNSVAAVPQSRKR
jgi:hypothetical protein